MIRLLTRLDMESETSIHTTNHPDHATHDVAAWLSRMAMAALSKYLWDYPRPTELHEGCLHIPNPNGGPDIVVHPDGGVDNGTPEEVAELLMPSTHVPTPIEKILAP